METSALSTDIEQKKEAIRNELGIYYPSTRFEIRQTKQMNEFKLVVSYTDGPCKTKVRNVLRSFESGCYDSRGNKRISIELERNMSQKAQDFLLEQTQQLFGFGKPLGMQHWLPKMNCTAASYIGTIFRFWEF